MPWSVSSQAEPAIPELTCQELVELVTDYLEDTLTPAERVRFEEHLANCPACGTYLDQFRATIANLGRLAEQDIAPEVLADLQQAFRDWHAHRGNAAGLGG